MPTMEMTRPVRRAPAVRAPRRADNEYTCPLCEIYGGEVNESVRKTIEDVEAGRNLIGPFETIEECWASMMAGMEALDD